MGMEKQTSHVQSTVTVTLPGFQGRTTKNPAEVEHRNTKKKKQGKVGIICSDNGDFAVKHLNLTQIKCLS